MNKRKVVVTGLGMVCPVGNDVNTAWQAIIAGQSGIETLSHLDTTAQSVHFGGSVKNLDIEQYINKKEARKMEPFIHYGLIAAMQAVDDAGLNVDKLDANRIGVAISAGIGGLGGIENAVNTFNNKGARRISPFFVPSSIINMVSGHLSIQYGFKGPNIAVVTACASGTHSIGDAARLIEYGDADVMIAGGAEMATTNIGLGGFAASRALSVRNDDPKTASRPWDKDRDGFVLADGAGIVVLEEYTHAKKRGATIYGQLLGYGMSADAYHMTLPAPDGEGAARCMKATLDNAGVNPEQVGYINAHGTSTPAGDIAETLAIKSAFGNHLPLVSSSKSMTGHLLGAAGGIESVFTVLSLQDQIAPPTINIFNQDSACDLDYVANEARQIKIDYALSNSFGFGGTNASLLFAKI